MLDCNTMRVSVILSGGLLTLGIVLGVIAMTTPFAVPISQLALLLVLSGAVVLAATFLGALLPGAARRLDGCRH